VKHIHYRLAKLVGARGNFAMKWWSSVEDSHKNQQRPNTDELDVIGAVSQIGTNVASDARCHKAKLLIA
jgi:hypothetical protein